MLHIFTGTHPVLPLIFSSNPMGDPPPPGGGKIKPPTVNQPDSAGSEAGIKPPTATDEPESNPQAPADDDIIIKGG